MSSYKIINIREIVYSTGSMQNNCAFFEAYGGWNRVGQYETNADQLNYWGLGSAVEAEEILIQSNHYPSGQIRLIQFKNTTKEHIRSSQQPWDTGGIMDINLRVHEVENNFNRLREMGWHGLSDPLLQQLGPFKLYDILMKGYDDTIIAFTHRLEPPMETMAPINLPTHVYKTSLTVKDLETSKKFYVEQLGCRIKTEYQVRKDSPQENMFGLPHNLADKVTCKAVILKIHEGSDIDFQIVEFDGVTGKDFSSKAVPPNRGFLLYRVELKGLDDYLRQLKEKGCAIYKEKTKLHINPYGPVTCFSVRSPGGAIWEFFEVD